jgi:hypothetical protein
MPPFEKEGATTQGLNTKFGMICLIFFATPLRHAAKIVEVEKKTFSARQRGAFEKPRKFLFKMYIYCFLKYLSNNSMIFFGNPLCPRYRLLAHTA